MSLEFPVAGSCELICIIRPGKVFRAEVVEVSNSYTSVPQAEATIKEPPRYSCQPWRRCERRK